jgi:hypothetical protein
MVEWVLRGSTLHRSPLARSLDQILLPTGETARRCSASGRDPAAVSSNPCPRVIARTRMTGRDDYEAERATVDCPRR